tara:strand:+ start:4253 stop:4894 length:642 start_codon:yes stop_codon:yes gene_type:complete
MNKKYKVIKNVLSKSVASFFTDYYFMKQQVAFKMLKEGYISSDRKEWGTWSDPQALETYSCYSDLNSETLLVTLHPLIEKTFKTNLIPTYSYMRIYKKGDVLKKHTDRDECEVSATLNLGGSFWPIYFKEKNKKLIKVNLKHGDLAIYKGSEIEHWREHFDGEYCVQVFLHYTTEKNKHLTFDNREMLGLPAVFKRDKGIIQDIEFHNKLFKK